MKTSEARFNRAERVKSLLEEIQFYDFMEMARGEVVREFVDSAPHETKKRESAYQTLWVMQEFERHIQSILSEGTVAKLELDRSSKRG